MKIPDPLCKIGETLTVINYRTARRVDGSVGKEKGVCVSISYQANQFHKDFEWHYSFVLKRTSRTGKPIILNYKHSDLV